MCLVLRSATRGDRTIAWLVAWVVVLMPTGAFAHRPWFEAEGHALPGDALRIPDLALSTVTYRTVTCAAPQLWMTFESAPGQELHFQLGVPRLPWLARYRPTVAVLAPGLPRAVGVLPFTVPPGLGVRVFPSSALPAREYHESVTQTDSWILQTETFTLTEGGRGYLVAWDPGRQTGKFWLAVGRAEDFGPRDWLMLLPWIRQARIFHGAFPHALRPAPPVSCGSA